MVNKSNTFKILSIDGGGIKGLYSAIILNRLKKKYGPISDYFDMVCGTSTGGIIALGIGLGISTEKIVEFYKSFGPKIFKRSIINNSKILSLRQLLFSSKYSDKVLKDALVTVLKDKIMNDSKCCLCIPAVNAVNMKGIIFKTSHNINFNRDGSLLMTDVALATSAAPTFFPISKIKGISDFLVDGGLWANNPSLIGAIEAVSYFVGNEKKYKKFSILSLSNLSISEGWNPYRSRKASAFTWKDSFLSAVMDSNCESVHNLLKIAYNNKYFPIDIYYRVKNPHLSDAQKKSIGLDKADKNALVLLEDLGQTTADYIINDGNVASFFKSKTREWQFPINNLE